MEIKTLRYYLTIVREGNISRAAEVLHFTQPALSRYMTQLEEELGTKLFTRGKKLKLTDAGVMLQQHAERIISMVEDMERSFKEQTEVNGCISIGASNLNFFRVLPEAIKRFNELNPNVKFRIYTNNSEYIKEQIEQGVLDFGLLADPIDLTNLDYIRPNEKGSWGLLMRKDSPLAQKPYITKEDLYGIPLMVTDRTSLQQEFSSWLGEEMHKLDIKVTHNILADVAALVSSGFVYALVMDCSCALFDERKLVYKPLYPELPFYSVFAWRRHNLNSVAAYQFLEFLKSMLNSHTEL